MRYHPPRQSWCLPVILLALLFPSALLASDPTGDDAPTSTVDLQTLEGGAVTLTISHEVSNARIVLSSPGISPLCLGDVSGNPGDPKSQVLDGKFLSLSYGQRGGTSCSTRRTVIICVSGKRIYESFEAPSEYNCDLTRVFDPVADSLHLFDEHSRYHLTNLSVAQSLEGLTLSLIEADTVTSRYNPSQNCRVCDTVHFLFSASDKIFYNKYLELMGNFHVGTLGGDTSAVSRLGGDRVPAIVLRGEERFFWKSTWCHKITSTSICLDSSACGP
jgi:hypothetical protein